MLLTETDWLVHKAHHEELIRAAAKERLARDARQALPDHHGLGYITIHGLVARFIAWSSRLLPTIGRTSACCLSNSYNLSINTEPGDAKLCC